MGSNYQPKHQRERQINDHTCRLALLRRFGSDPDDFRRFRPQNANETNGA
jgi:hypothetical protein